MTPWMWSPSASAAARGLSSTDPTPSPGTYPSPPAPKLRHRPSLAANRPCPSMKYLLGWMSTFTPPAIATLQLPALSDSQARWIAVNADEHAVSTATLGPWKLKKYDTRFA